MILLPNTSLEQSLRIADKLRRKVETFSFCTQFSITCSFGVTEVLEDDTTISLFNRVDKALYQAKENGKNRVEFI